MSFYFRKNRGKWCYSFEHNGRRYAGYCVHPETGEYLEKDDEKHKKLAKSIEAYEKAKIKFQKKPIKKPADLDAYTLAEAVLDYSENVAQRYRSWKDIKIRLDEILFYFGPLAPLNEIDVPQIDKYINYSCNQSVKIFMGGPSSCAEKKEKKMKDTGRKRSIATTNRYISALKAVFNRAYKMGKLNRIPNIEKFDEGESIPNPISIDNAKTILAHSPPHLLAVITIAVHTGMRLREILHLKWRQVDYNEMVIRLQRNTKSKKGRIVFINNTVYEILQNLPNTCDRVITYKGKPINSVASSWNTALKKSEVPHHRFHDFRATFCTLLASQKDVSMLDVKDLAGHSSPQTTLRYMKTANKHLRKAVTELADLADLKTENHNQNPQPEKKEEKEKCPKP
ncbi:MAG: site-specific integrase [Alphaproteobacteria bacterium]|nr:site-specific integrase [Alphaproteobacteria bacterium]